MKTSNNGKQLISYYEGLRTEAYKDQAGLLTIGVGHLLTEEEQKSGVINFNGRQIDWNEGVTHDEAMELLSNDLEKAENAVNELVKVKIDQNTFDSLVSFSFNCGRQALADSKLLRLLNGGSIDKAALQLMEWNKAGGLRSQGLIRRRTAELLLWRTGKWE